MPTHAIAVQGPGGTAAGAITAIGNAFTFPAGGPWLIHDIWMQVVRTTNVPNEGAGGAMIVNSVSGDITPDPAPGTYPVVGPCIAESADSAISAVPLNLWPVDWTASPKAQMTISYLNHLAITTGSEVAAGVIFGDARPERRPLKFCDGVRASFASATEQSIGTIILAEKVTRIVGIFADLNKGDAATVGEEIMATIRLDSNDIKFPPSQYPCNRAFNASDGTPAGQSATPMSNFIPVDIPTLPGARIDVFATTSVSVTGNADVQVYIAYE